MAEEKDDFGLSAQGLADFESARKLYSRFGLGSEEERSAQLEDQKRMTRANILFDLAQAGLVIASTPPVRGESPAATLARAAAASEFFPRVGLRTTELQKSQDALKAQQRQMDMAAVQRAQQLEDKREEQAFQMKLAGAKATATKPNVFIGTNSSTKKSEFFDFNKPADLAKLQELVSAGSIDATKLVKAGEQEKVGPFHFLYKFEKGELKQKISYNFASKADREKYAEDSLIMMDEPQYKALLEDKSKTPTLITALESGKNPTNNEDVIAGERLRLTPFFLNQVTFNYKTKDETFKGKMFYKVTYKDGLPEFETKEVDEQKVTEKLISDLANLGFSSDNTIFNQEVQNKQDIINKMSEFETVTLTKVKGEEILDTKQVAISGNFEERKASINEILGLLKDDYKIDDAEAENILSAEAERLKLKVTKDLNLEIFENKENIKLDNAKILAEHKNDLAKNLPIYRVQDNKVIKIDPKNNTITVEKELEPTSNVGSLPRDIFNKLDETQKGAFVESLLNKEIFDTKVISDTLYLFRKDGQAFKGPDGEMVEYQAIVDGTGDDKNLKLYRDPNDPGVFYSSYDGGKTYVYDYQNPDTGLITRLNAQMPVGVVPVSDLTAIETVDEGLRKAKALQAYQRTSKFMTDYLDELNIRSLEDLNKYGEIITADELENLRMTEEELALAKEVLLNDLVAVEGPNKYIEAANKGTGIWGGFFAALNQVGGVTGFTDNFFQDVASARQSLRGLVLLGRAALILSPRFPVYELQKVEAVFPSLNPFTAANARTEANKLIMLKEMLETQLETNMENLTLSYADKTIISDIEKNNVQIRNLLHKLRGIDTTNTNLVNKEDERDYNSIVDRANQMIVPTE